MMAACLLWHTSISQAQTLERFEFREPHLGTIVEITLYAPDESVANDCVRAAFARIQELNKILSDYDPDSELMRLCRTAGTGQCVPVSAELFEVLAKSLELAQATDGEFDVSIGPVVKLWRTSRRLRKLPTDSELAAARERVGWQQIRLDPKARSVELQTKGMLLDLGGIAKGYIADQARAVLIKRNMRKCLVSVAGDISAGDPPPDRDGWRIGIAALDKADGEPVRYLRLANCSVSTAGDAFQFVTINGIRYSHIVDPATGVGLTRRISVTVVAPHGIVADGLDTAASILGPERGLKLIEQIPGAVGMIMLATDDGVTVTESNGFSKYVIP
jgi:thiamine biosynthesis lipoprotein